jgi:hypothetical protein
MLRSNLGRNLGVLWTIPDYKVVICGFQSPMSNDKLGTLISPLSQRRRGGRVERRNRELYVLETLIQLQST